MLCHRLSRKHCDFICSNIENSSIIGQSLHFEWISTQSTSNTQLPRDNMQSGTVVARSWSVRIAPLLQSFASLRYNSPGRLRPESSVAGVVVGWSGSGFFRLEERRPGSPVEAHRALDLVEVGVDVGVLSPAFGTAGCWPLHKAGTARIWAGRTPRRAGPKRTIPASALWLGVRGRRVQRRRRQVRAGFLEDRPRDRHKKASRRYIP